MSWHQYTLAFRLCSPLHIGWRKTGNLMQTRPYVSGKVLWAALTARLTRDAGDGADGQKYVEIGKAVNHALRFGYLYPALSATQPVERAEELTVHYPWSDPHFDYRFLDSQASTALNYDQQSAESGLLHETEFIRPYARRLPNQEQSPQVYLLGDLFVRSGLLDSGLLDKELQGWQAALTRLQLGGERGYGWGRVQPLTLSEPIHVAEPTRTVEQGAAVAAHVHASSAALVGPVEPLVGWERDNQRPDHPWRLTPQVHPYYAPGSKVAQTTTFTIGNDGRWHLLT